MSVQIPCSHFLVPTPCALLQVAQHWERSNALAALLVSPRRPRSVRTPGVFRAWLPGVRTDGPPLFPRKELTAFEVHQTDRLFHIVF
jgi:hypothetical protein